jgi:putative FmdB family regulatory protein
MPIYEYACTACGERTEAKQGFDDPPLQECPVCGGKLRKLYSPVGIVFKGSGFYSTDKKGQKRGGAEKAEKKDSDGSKSQDQKTTPSTEKTSSSSTEQSTSEKSSGGRADSKKSGSDSSSRTSGERR